MSLMFTKLVLGVDWSGGALSLLALTRRFRHFAVVGTLQVSDPKNDAARSKVSAFLDRYRVREARVIVGLPREALLVRFLDLPVETEPNLAKVVGYQIEGLHPFREAQVYWDCAVVARNVEKKQIRVMVVIAERSRLDSYLKVLRDLGLRVSSLTLAACCLVPLVKELVPGQALVVCGRDNGAELIGFDKGGLCVTRLLPIEPADSAADRFERELHSVRAALPAAGSNEIAIFACGSVPPALTAVVPEAATLPPPKLQLTWPSGLDLAAFFPALAAAHAGLVPRSAPSINLLPAAERWQPRRPARVPIYALEASAALLALLVLGHGWIESGFYARALDRQIDRLAPGVKQVRLESQQANALSAHAQLLDGLRGETWRKLELLQELTRLLPDGTWVQEVQIEESTVEVYGFSSRAADLVQPLENSPYFSQVEFTSPITRDTQNNKEIFRMRMRLRQPVQP